LKPTDSNRNRQLSRDPNPESNRDTNLDPNGNGNRDANRAASRPPKRIPATDADGLLDELTTRQHLSPHRPLSEVMNELVDRVGACPEAAQHAMERLDMNRDQSIGRLRRGELIQLARTMHRLWSQALTAAAQSNNQPHSSPAQTA
jgi:hypothetical protein